MYALNTFYKDVDDPMKTNVLWNVVNWSTRSVMYCNDNTFVSNRMLGYNTVFNNICTKNLN